MKIFITGVSGFIGSHTARRLLESGHTVWGAGARPRYNAIAHERFHYLSANTARAGQWQESARNADAVINLAGESIFARWSASRKKRLYDSRIQTTRRLVECLENGSAPRVIFSASAVGYYGSRADDVLTEKEPPGSDFLANLAREWEAEAYRAEISGCRVVVGRFGMALGAGEGALSLVPSALKSFVGGPLGNGMQWLSWIHIADLAAAVVFALDRPEISGPLNICAPEPVRNRDFAALLGEALGKPAARKPVSRWTLRLALGEAADAVTASHRAVPSGLEAAGFRFRFPHLKEAFEDLFPN